MAGQTIRLVDLKTYDFSDVAASGEAGVYVAQHVDVSQWKAATLMIRVHSATVAQSGAQFKVKAFADGYTDEDPALVFTAAPEVASVTISQSDVSEPYYVTSELTGGDMGALVTVVLSGKQDSTKGTLSGVFSIDLALKDE
jgi:hypothetical protein